jgi:hypothetical protein
VGNKKEEVLTSSCILDEAATPSLADKLIRDKHREYYRNSSTYRIMYYATRFLAGLSAGVLPFLVWSRPLAATILSGIIVVCFVGDAVFDPRSKWKLYSSATDLLTIAELKANGQYEKSKEMLDIIVATECDALAHLKGLDEVLSAIEQKRSTGRGDH